MNALKKSRILVIDDIEANRISLEALLESEDVEIIKVGSGNGALKILLKQSIDIVLLDVQMPGMNGFEVAEIMKMNPKTREIPIIFITAISKEEKYIFKGYQMGAVDYIYKPINNEILKNKVNVFIRLNEQKQIIFEESRKLEEKIIELEIAKQKLRGMINQDGLTGIGNRRLFDEYLKNEWGKSKDQNLDLALIMIDIDYFKKYNDTYGHLKGDRCLIQVARALEETSVKFNGIIARYGGEEFVAILPGKNIEQAVLIAEAMKVTIEDLEMEHSSSEASEYVTVSIGVVSMKPVESVELEKLMELADEALYEAKKGGRNRFVLKSF